MLFCSGSLLWQRNAHVMTDRRMYFAGRTKTKRLSHCGSGRRRFMGRAWGCFLGHPLDRSYRRSHPAAVIRLPGRTARGCASARIDYSWTLLDSVLISCERRWFYSFPTPAFRNTVSLGAPPRQHAANLEFTTIAGNRCIPNRRARRTTASSFMLRICTSSEEEASRFTNLTVFSQPLHPAWKISIVAIRLSQLEIKGST